MQDAESHDVVVSDHSRRTLRGRQREDGAHRLKAAIDIWKAREEKLGSQRKSRFSQRCLDAAPPNQGWFRSGGSTEISDMGVFEIDEMTSRAIGRVFEVDENARDVRMANCPIEDDHRRALATARTSNLLRGQARTAKNHSSNRLSGEHAQELLFFPRVFSRIEKEEHVFVDTGFVLNAADNLGKKWIEDIGDKKNDRAFE